MPIFGRLGPPCKNSKCHKLHQYWELEAHLPTVESFHPFLSITCQIRHKQILRFCIVSIAQVASKATSTMASAVVAKMASILAKAMFGVAYMASEALERSGPWVTSLSALLYYHRTSLLAGRRPYGC